MEAADPYVPLIACISLALVCGLYAIKRCSRPSHYVGHYEHELPIELIEDGWQSTHATAPIMPAGVIS